MKLETKYLRMPKLFEYPIKSYLKNVTWCEMPLTHTVASHSWHQTLSPSFYCFYNTLHTPLLAWPSFLLVVFVMSLHVNVALEAAGAPGAVEFCASSFFLSLHSETSYLDYSQIIGST
jgi:hypothetical protein